MKDKYGSQPPVTESKKKVILKEESAGLKDKSK